ncbi:PAS domain S-box protein [Rubellimicrobium aerolatum]|uniref:histidine kinase n=1 Tax=Rubellimicrobium aerolatum TaxID=490979 RepID=A0ABW0S8M3_9RHOB|nr:PAS domain S-box protein [Rubellimicrobium aerolatum]MBP1804649.1 PAS domain S-box-containing protein [Rubellimicrobium aerolatum]
MRHLSWIGLLALLGLALLVGAMFQAGLRLERSRGETERRQIEHMEVLLESQRALSALLDAETGQRGYLLTGDDRYLGSYRDGRARIDGHLDRLAELAAGSPRQAAVAADLERLSDARMALLDRALLLAGTGRADQAVALVASDRGQAFMDRVRALVARLAAEEELRLDARTRQAEAAATDARRLLAVAFAIGLGLVAVAAGYALSAARAEGRARGAEELARSEAERQETLTRLSAIVDTAVDAIVVIDESGTIQSFNPAAEVIFGYAADEARGRNVRMLMPPGHAAAHDGYLARYLRTGERRIIGIGREVDGRRSDGGLFPVDLSITEWRDAGGRRFFTAVMRDISLRRESERRLQDSEARFRQLAETIDDVFYVLELEEERISYVSPAYERLWGRPVAELMRDNRAFLEGIHPEDRPLVEAAIRRQHAGGGSEAEYRLRRPDGSERRVHDRAFVTTDPITGRRRVVGIAEDVTERRAAEIALRQLNETLEEKVATAVAEKQAAAAQLFEMQKMDTIGQLTGGVAHDFNNLLTPIVGSLERAQKRVDDERTQRLIAGGLDAAERARLLVSRLLAFARRTHLEARPVDIAALVGGMTDLIQRSIGPQIAVAVTAPPGLPPARVDPNQLELALLNLAVNARDAMPGGGTLTLAVGAAEAGPGDPSGLAPGRYLRLSAIDTGTGMDPETLRRCIEPFYSTKGVGKGTGLGLSMVHGLAAQSGGRLLLASSPGGGTRAEIWLPEAAEVLPAESPSPAEAVPAPWSATLLVVDDQDLVRIGTAEMLRELGYEVVEAAGAAQALDLVRRGLAPDLLVTDYLMPGMSGAQLAAELREMRPGLPVLLVTGYAEVAQAPAGRLPRLAKPFRQADLAQRVAGLLDQGKVVSFRARARAD